MKRREAIKILGTTTGGLFIAQFIPGCKSPSGPSDPKTMDVVEFMYQRTMQIVSPNESDPRGMSIYSDPYGGFNADGWQSSGSGQWTCSKLLEYNQRPYFVYVVDGKVAMGYKQIAHTIFARIKGQSNWIELTCVEPRGSDEWAKFIIDKNGIHVPSSSSFSR